VLLYNVREADELRVALAPMGPSPMAMGDWPFIGTLVNHRAVGDHIAHINDLHAVGDVKSTCPPTPVVVPSAGSLNDDPNSSPTCSRG